MASRRGGSGRFLTLGRFEVRIGPRDQFGNAQSVWAPYIERRVFIDETPGAEGLEGGVLQSHTAARCRVRADAKVLALPTDARLRAKGRIWSVLSVARGDPYDTETRGTVEIALDAGVADGGHTPSPVSP